MLNNTLQPNDQSQINAVYAGLDAAIVDSLRNSASMIRTIKLSQAKLIILTGQHLIKAHKLVPHGYWATWLELECSFSIRTAGNYMAVAEHIEDTKSETVADLKPTTLYKLTATLTPEHVRQDILQSLGSAVRPTEAEIVAKVDAAQKRERVRLRDLSETSHLSESEREVELRSRALNRLKEDSRDRQDQGRDATMREEALQRVAACLVRCVSQIDELIADLTLAKVPTLPELLRQSLSASLESSADLQTARDPTMRQEAA